MQDYLLILRDHEQRWETFSDEQLRQILDRFATWNQTMQENQQFVGAGKLSSDRGKTVRTRNGELVVDGPFSEAKEAIAGYYCVRAESIDEAVEIAQGCPILTYGGSVEVRVMVSRSE